MDGKACKSCDQIKPPRDKPGTIAKWLAQDVGAGLISGFMAKGKPTIIVLGKAA